MNDNNKPRVGVLEEAWTSRVLPHVRTTESGCWEWQRYRTGKGYGKVSIGGRLIAVHRLAYTVSKGDPGELHVCHSCDNPPCCNPDHLWAGTNLENVADRQRKGRDHDVSGMKNPRARMTPDMAESIVRLRASGMSQDAISAAVGISQKQVSLLLGGKHWLSGWEPRR